MLSKSAPKRNHPSTAFNAYNGNNNAKKPKTTAKDEVKSVTKVRDEEYDLMEDGLDDVLSQACEEFKSQTTAPTDTVIDQERKKAIFKNCLKLVLKDVKSFKAQQNTSTPPVSNSEKPDKLAGLRWGASEIAKLLPNDPRILQTTSSLASLRQHQDEMSQEI